MTNYTIVGTGEINASVSTNFSPAGVPSGAGDQVTFAANQRLVIPSGHTFDSVVVPAAGSSAANRSGFIIEGGTFVARNDSTWGAYNYLHARGSGTATIDLNGYDIYYSAQTGTNVNNVISTDGTVFLRLYSSAGLSYISQAALTASVGLLDISNFLIENVSLLFGGRFYPGHHVRVQKGVFYNAGRWETSQYSHRSDDFIVDRVLYIGTCQNPAFETPLNKIINLRAQNGDATGTTSTNRRIKDLVILSEGVTNSLFRMDYCPSNITASHLYTNTSQQIGNNSVDWTNCFFYNAAVGSIGTSNKWAFCFAAINSNNPHTLELVTTWEDSILESLYGSTGLQNDGGDYLMSGSATANKYGRRSLWIDTYGGAILNTVGTTGGATGTWVLEHCTQVIDCRDANYGQLIRNENSGFFAAGASVTVQSNILRARSNPSGATSIRAVNMENGATTGQIDVLRNNCLSIPSADLSVVYFRCPAGTDDIFEDPQFVDESAGLLSWGAQYGYADYDECCTELMLGVVGYDPTNHILDDSFLTGRDVADLIDYVAAAYRPTNPALATAAHDGTTIGAFDYLSSGIDGQLNKTQDSNTLSASGSLLIAASSSIGESEDTASSLGAVSIAAASSITETDDSASSTGTLSISGSSSISEASDTVSSAAALSIDASASITEQADTLSASGIVAAPGSITGELAATEQSDTVSSAGALSIVASASISEAADSVSATGALSTGGMATITEVNDQLSSAVVLSIVGSLTKTESNDTLRSTNVEPTPTDNIYTIKVMTPKNAVSIQSTVKTIKARRI